MRVVVAGGGKIGRQLARMFGEAEHDVTVVESRADRVEALAELKGRVTPVSGDATDPGTLALAGANKADVFVAATGSDEANMLCCYLARTWFGIGRTIARVNDPRNEHMFTPEYGCDTAISYSGIIARMVMEEAGFDDVITLLKLRKGQLTLLEGEVHERSELAGKTLADVSVPPEIIIVAILRGEDTLVARGATRVLPGDKLIALNSKGDEETFRDLLR